MEPVNFVIPLVSLILAALPYLTRIVRWSTHTATLKQLTQISLCFGFANAIAAMLIVAITILS